ncbi:hypothetical protein FPV67DRAFT_1398264, partial [Lyophyllum atratum]
PTLEELRLFDHLSIPEDFSKRTLELMAVRRLRIGDPVKVMEGEAQGTIGVVEDIVNDEVLLRILPDDMELSLPLSAVRKYVKVGDEVIIATGPLTGVTGWVISVE